MSTMATYPSDDCPDNATIVPPQFFVGRTPWDPDPPSEPDVTGCLPAIGVAVALSVIGGLLLAVFYHVATLSPN